MERVAWRLVGLSAWTQPMLNLSTPCMRALHNSTCSAEEKRPPADGQAEAATTSQPPTPPPSTSSPASSSLPSPPTSAVARSLMAQFMAGLEEEGQGLQREPSKTSKPGRRGDTTPSPSQTPTRTPPPDDEPTNDVIRLVLRAVENCKPQLKVKQFKEGNRVTTMPYMVHPNEQRSLAIRWILEATHKRKEGTAGSRRQPIAECLATELLLAAQKQGPARMKRDEMHRLAVENRAHMRRQI